jgi:hypothetical protein
MWLFCGKRKLRPAVGPTPSYQNLMLPETAANEPSATSKAITRERIGFLLWGTDGYE